MLNKSIKISSANVNTKIASYLIDLGFMLISALAIFFASFYGIFKPTSNFDSNEKLIQETLEKNDMTIDYADTYLEYEAVCQKFYFETYPNEIIENFYDRVGERLTIQHIYNIEVLGLPKDPNLDTFDDSDYFIFKTEGKKILVNEVATTRESGGPTFDRNIKTIFRNGYEALFSYLNTFDKAYNNAKWENVHTQSYARLVAGLTSIIVFALIIPISNKHKVSLGERIMKVANVNFNDGYFARWWKVLLKPFILFTLPMLGIYFGSVYAIVILTVAPLFINFLVMILTKDNLDITQRILGLDLAYVKESLLFENEKDEISYVESEEFKHLEDKEYLEKLSSLKEVDLSESRSEAITKDIKKNKEK